MTTLELARSITFQNILLATDFSQPSKSALRYAVGIAHQFDADLHVVNVIPPRPRLPITLDPLPEDLDRSYAKSGLQIKQFVTDNQLEDVRHHELVGRGPVQEVISDLIRRKHIDLLILGTHGRTGFKKIAMGSVAEELFRAASCPVLTVGPSIDFRSRLLGIQRVLLATDFGPASMRALPYAIELANEANGTLILMHMVPPIETLNLGFGWYPAVHKQGDSLRRHALAKLDELIARESDLNCDVEKVVEFRTLPEGILDMANEGQADLIVMGVKGESIGAVQTATHLSSTIAQEVVRQAKCPVLTVRA